MIVYPFVVLLYPFWYLGKTLVTISFLNYFISDTQKERNKILKMINKNSNKQRRIRIIDDNVSISTDATNAGRADNKVSEIINSYNAKIVRSISKNTNQLIRNNKPLLFVKVFFNRILTIISGDDNVSI